MECRCGSCRYYHTAVPSPRRDAAARVKRDPSCSYSGGTIAFATGGAVVPPPRLSRAYVQSLQTAIYDHIDD
eukprot:COSAG06_NODE_2256_length_7222_cov_14.605363_5_plen_72_part_00